MYHDLYAEKHERGGYIRALQDVNDTFENYHSKGLRITRKSMQALLKAMLNDYRVLYEQGINNTYFVLDADTNLCKGFRAIDN